jgi:hypothetical protein
MRRTSPLAKTEEEVNTLLETIKPAADVFDVATYDACQKVLNDTLGESDTETTTTSESTRYSNNTPAQKDTGIEGVQDIESAFNDLLS